MLKCEYNEDCSNYPMCGKTCGLSLEELLMYQAAQIKDIKFQKKQAMAQLNNIVAHAYSAMSEVKEPDYIPTCPCGYVDCISDPAYIRCYHPKWWKELGMPTSCADDNYGKPCWETDEDGLCYCQYYDDEDK